MHPIIQWLLSDATYPRWALAILLLTAFCVLAAAVGLIAFEIGCHLTERRMKHADAKHPGHRLCGEPPNQYWERVSDVTEPFCR